MSNEGFRRQHLPSLGDVARRANVSVMTVSNVVNGRTARVSREVAQRIRGLIEEMGYRPQLRGRSLRLNRAFAIGLTIMHPDQKFLDDPYITQVAAGMSNFLSAVGYGLMINGVRDLAGLEATTGRVASYDGLAVIASGRRAERIQAYRALSRLNCPMLIIQDTAPRGMSAVHSVLQDDYGGAFRLARSIIELGSLDILLAIPSHTWPAVERRRAGILAAAKGVSEVNCLACDESDFEATIEAISRTLARGKKPDAIMGANDQIAFAAMKAAERLGLSVPKDVMVTGFNAFSVHQFSSSSLTSVASPAYEIGQSAGEALVRCVEGVTVQSQQLVLPVEPINGGTIRHFSLNSFEVSTGSAKRRVAQ